MMAAPETIALFASPAALMLTAGAAGAAWMRSVFAAAAFALVGSLAAGAGALTLGSPSIALAIVVVGGGFAFAMLAGSILLTARAVVARPLVPRAIGGALGALVVLALLWVAPDVEGGRGAPVHPAYSDYLLIGMMALVGGAAAHGLLGFGERAAFARRRDRRL
jgi:hypothetical protein